MTIQTTPSSVALQWVVDPGITLISPVTYTAQMSQGTSEWQDIGSVVDGYYLSTNQKPFWGKIVTRHFRISLTDAVSNTYVSNPVVPTQLWDRRDFLICKEIVRRFSKGIDMYSGEPGYLLKRKLWGTKCTECADTTWGKSDNSHCPVCYGTGFVGGFFTPTKLPIMGKLQGKHWEQNQGTNDLNLRGGITLNVPTIEAKDIWISLSDGKRYEITQLTTVSEHRGIILVVQIGMAPLPSDDPIYDYPIGGTTT